MKEKISRISIGIRHQRSFRLPEIAGSIVDYIISSSPFGKDFFQASDTILNGFESRGRILIGADDGASSMVIDTDSIILNLKSENFDVDLARIKSELVPFIKKIFTKFSIENINRVGLVFEFQKLSSDQVNEITKTITTDTFSHSDIFQLRFSQKDADIMSMVKKDILDYANNIIAVSKNTENEVFAKFDYQFYYSPEISKIDDVDFDQFIDAASDRLAKKFFNWMKP